MTKFRNHTNLFRALAIFMSLVLAMPSFAVVPSFAAEVSQLIYRLRGDLPSPFSTLPRPRPHRDNLRRDADRDKWWTPEARAAYEEALLAAGGDVLGLTERVVASLASSMTPGWGGGATTGCPVPGEGAFPGGGSGRRGNELGVTGTVNSATQNLTLSLPVVRFPTRGDLEVDFTLYHNSHSSSNVGFSTGWTHSYSTHIVWTLTHAFV